MFAYCLNNPANMKDSEGTDAIYVTDYAISRGLPLFGHSYLFVQDSIGEWYKTEYSGKTKANATVWVYDDNVTVKKMLNGEKLIGLKYTYISGDFTDSLALARKYEGTNYGGYNLLTNNCLHYAKEILLAGTFQNESMKKYTMNTNDIIPHNYHKYLHLGNVVGKLKGAISGVKEIWKAIRNYY